MLYCGWGIVIITLDCSAPALAWEAATSLRFAPTLERLAADLVNRGFGGAPFNAVHLRLEKDYAVYTGPAGGEEVYIFILDICTVSNTVHKYA